MEITPRRPISCVMRAILAPLLALFSATAPAEAAAQISTAPWRPTDPTRPAWSARDLSTGDAHRLEMERLRGVADANRDLARDQSLQARRSLDALRSRAAPAPAPPPVRATVTPAPTPPPPADIRRMGDVSQIDDWLDRRPN